MNNESIIIACTVVGVAVAYLSYKQGSNKCIRDDASEHTSVTAQLNYISRGIDDIKLDAKDTSRRLDNTIERVTRVEESAKQAHKRIDDLGKDD
jgi:peptidoglycan hydrolase CwlO-like protein